MTVWENQKSKVKFQISWKESVPFFVELKSCLSSYHCEECIKGSCENSITQEYVNYGNYFDILSEVLPHTENIHFVDGTLLKVNPQKEFTILLDFLNIDKSVLEWRFNDDKQFFCLYRPVKFCLDEHKGSHRKVISKSKSALWLVSVILELKWNLFSKFWNFSGENQATADKILQRADEKKFWNYFWLFFYMLFHASGAIRLDAILLLLKTTFLVCTLLYIYLPFEDTSLGITVQFALKSHFSLGICL